MLFADFKGPMMLIMSERHGSDTLQGSIIYWLSGFALRVRICPVFLKNHETNTLGTHFDDIIHTVHVMTLSCLKIMTHGQ